MEIRTLRYFLAVAREENMTHAAELLHVTQPTLSKALKSLEGSFRLAYNGSLFAREGLGILLTLNNLVDTSPESGLVFLPLYPHLEMKMYLIWNKYQSFTPIAERLLSAITSSCASSRSFRYSV